MKQLLLLLLLLQVYESNKKKKKTTRPRFVPSVIRPKVFFSRPYDTHRDRIYDNCTNTTEREQKVDKIIQPETCFVFYQTTTPFIARSHLLLFFSS
jgi:apolipoprotein N-acyltransferase